MSAAGDNGPMRMEVKAERRDLCRPLEQRAPERTARAMLPATAIRRLSAEASPFAHDHIMVVDVSAGMGHKKIGNAIVTAARMSPLAGRYQVEMGTEVNPYLNKVLGPLLFGYGYETLLKFSAGRKVYDYLYNTAPKKNGPEATRWGVRQLMTPELVELLTRDKSKVIVCPHPILATMANILQIDGLLPPDTKIVSVVTDFSVTEAYNAYGLIIVPHPALKEQLVAMGKDPAMVRVVSGLPAGPEFTGNFDWDRDHATVRHALAAQHPELAGTDPLFVAAGGGKGLMLDKLVSYLKDWHPSRPVKLAVICGDNPALLAEVRALLGKIDSKITLVPLGKVDDMHLYMKAADVLLSKPGGSTLAEAAALGQTLNAFSYIPGQEEKNYKLLTGTGAIIGLDLHELADVDAVLARSAVARGQMKKQFPHATTVAAEYAKVIADYAAGKIAESPREKGEREALEIARFAKMVKPATARFAANAGHFLHIDP